MQKTTYRLIVDATWPDRETVRLKVDGVPRDVEPDRVCRMLNRAIILGPAVLDYRSLKVGLYQIIGSTKPRRGRPPK